jgi:hypothetical protein
MASQARVLKFPRSDDKSSFVLLQATPNGSNRLDLKLVGTEGEEPYVASRKSFRHSPSNIAMWEKPCLCNLQHWLERDRLFDP